DPSHADVRPPDRLDPAAGGEGLRRGARGWGRLLLRASAAGSASGWERPRGGTPPVRTGEMALYGGAVRGDLLDLILIALAAAFAVAGYRQGFIVGVLSFVGFLGGAAVGAIFSPAIARAVVSGAARQALVAIIVVFLAAMIGQFVASLVGAAMRSRVTWGSATVVYAVGGAVVSVLSVLLI